MVRRLRLSLVLDFNGHIQCPMWLYFILDINHFQSTKVNLDPSCIPSSWYTLLQVAHNGTMGV